MEFIFWPSLFLICSSYFFYPLFLVVAAKIWARPVKKADIFPAVTLLIPAYNEEKVIAQKIENCLGLDYPEAKPDIVIASESNDRTNEIVESYKEKGVRLFAYPEREGKPRLIYKTVRHCAGEIIVLTDANAMLERTALRKLVRSFIDPKIGCVCGQLKYINPQEAAIGQGEGLYWRYEIFLKKQESKIQSVLGANGSIYGLRKNLYLPFSEEYPGDDLELPINVLQQGFGVVFDEEAVSFEETSQSFKQEFQRKKRIVSQFFRSTFTLLKKSFFPVRPVLIFQLVFHKILRWLVPLFLVMIFFSNIFLLPKHFYRLTMLLQVIFYGLAFLGYHQEKRGGKTNKAANFFYYFFMVNLAALIGLFEATAGKRKIVWEKVR